MSKWLKGLYTFVFGKPPSFTFAILIGHTPINECLRWFHSSTFPLNTLSFNCPDTAEDS